MQPACGQTDVSDCQDFCFSFAPPAVQRGVILSICGAAGNLDRGTATHKAREHKQTLIPGHYALFFFLAHTLAYTNTHLHTGDILSQRSQAGVELLTGLQNGTMGILGPLR